MFDNIETMRMAHALSRHAGDRQQVVARNLANSDTPGYRGQDVAPFADSYRDAREAGSTPDLRTSRPGHIESAEGKLASLGALVETGGEVSPNGNDVSVEREMARSAEVQMQHDMATSIYKSSLDILRASIGRR